MNKREKRLLTLVQNREIKLKADIQFLKAQLRAIDARLQKILSLRRWN